MTADSATTSDHDTNSSTLRVSVDSDNLATARFSWDGELIDANSAFSELLAGEAGLNPAQLLQRVDLVKLQQELDAGDQPWIPLTLPEVTSHQLTAIKHEHGDGFSILILALPGQARSTGSIKEIIDSLPLGLALFDQTNSLTHVNPALEVLLHLDASELLRGTATEFWLEVASRTTAPEIASSAFKQAAAGRDEQPHVEVEMAADPSSHLQINFFPIQAGGWGALFTDVSQARDQVSWKLDLLSMLAHDLRTPLATLKGHATALLTNYSRWSQPMMLEFLEAMDQGVDDLVRQVERSLALTRLESGRLGLQPEAISPQDLIQGALERAASVLGDLRVNTQLPAELPLVRVDPARVQEVLVNLLENAARHSPEDEPIQINAAASEVMVTFTVEDRGPGVPAERRRSIFEKYSQFEADHEGPGLGLFISQEIIEAHGGRIWVESPPAGQSSGAAFSFSVPIMPATPTIERQEVRSASPRPTEREGTILVVEDEPDLQALLKAILEPAGYQINITNGGPGALDYLATHEPAAVVLDLMLPRMDGLTVCRTIRRRSNLPILVLTSQAGAEDLVAAVDAGADDYLTKPFQSTELLARLRALLRRSKRWQQPPPKRPLTFDELVIEEDSRQAFLADEAVDLTPTEFELLMYLAKNRGQVLTHNQLIETLWPLGEGNRHSLFVHINRLRAKLEPDPENPRFIVTRWGVGYTFAPKKRSGS